jgi:hypothetical protein
VVMAKGTFLSFPSLSVLPRSKSYALHLSSNSSTAENTSFMNNDNKDNLASEPRWTYPAIVIPSKFPTQKDCVKDQDLLQDSQCEQEQGDKDKDHCRDSSLYGHIQTISQDLILDLLQRSDFRNFRNFAYFAFHALAYLACFAFSHISRSHTFRILCTHISCIFTYFAFHIFAFSCFLRFDTCYHVPP